MYAAARRHQAGPGLPVLWLPQARAGLHLPRGAGGLGGQRHNLQTLRRLLSRWRLQGLRAAPHGARVGAHRSCAQRKRRRPLLRLRRCQAHGQGAILSCLTKSHLLACSCWRSFSRFGSIGFEGVAQTCSMHSRGSVKCFRE